MEPWFYIVAFGTAIAGFAWMTPKSGDAGPKQEFVTEESYNRLLEDLEVENGELLDAVAKFKREHDGTVEKLGRRIVELEQQMKSLSEQPRYSEAPADFTPTAMPPSALPDQQIHAYSLEEASLKYDSAPSSTAVSDEEAAQPELANDSEPEYAPTTIRGRYAELLGMHETGKSVEQIAKATGMNKGEVQLILQLVKREEQHA